MSENKDPIPEIPEASPSAEAASAEAASAEAASAEAASAEAASAEAASAEAASAEAASAEAASAEAASAEAASAEAASADETTPQVSAPEAQTTEAGSSLRHDAEQEPAPSIEPPSPPGPTPPAGSSVAESRLPSSSKPDVGGPISLERIRQLRLSQQKGGSKPSNTRAQPKPVAPNFTAATSEPQAKLNPAKAGSGDPRGLTPLPTPPPVGTASKITVPSRRQPLSQDLEDEIAAAMGESDLKSILVGDASLQVGLMLEEGQRMQAKVVKAHGEFVFVSLGGANEGVLPSLQFEEMPEVGSQLDVIVRGYLASEGLYELTMPGNAVNVDDWSDIKEGEVVEAVITAANTGGLECKVGSLRGFIPASQAAEFRVEDLSEFVDQKVLCVITEANERRGNLVLSRRAVLEREKSEKRAERLEALEVGTAVEGIVRKILDFGAFVDIGGLDGLLHISQLSWERVKHPSEILEEGQKIQVRVDKIDPQSGKIGLSYRSLQEHPWTDIEARFPVGSLVKGSVTRIAEFGAFVRVATGVEGLVHISELAHHRVQNVSSVVSEGQEVDVKVLSVDAEGQRMSLSLKAAQAAPEKPAEDNAEATDEARPEPVLPKHRGPLKGGTGRPSGGDQFGLKW